jgi:hypothetical protein
MPTVLESAKEATYAAVGLNVLFVDEMNERMTEQREQFTTQFNDRFASQRGQFDEQLGLAREHGRKARERVQPLAQRTWGFYDSTMNRVIELAPAPIDGYVTDGVAKLREIVGEDIAKPVAADSEETAEKATKASTKK